MCSKIVVAIAVTVMSVAICIISHFGSAAIKESGKLFCGNDFPETRRWKTFQTELRTGEKI